MFKKLATKIKSLLSKLKKSDIIKDNKVLSEVIDEVSSNIDSVAAVADKSAEEIKEKVEQEVAKVVKEAKQAKKPGRPKKTASGQPAATKKATPKKATPKKKIINIIYEKTASLFGKPFFCLLFCICL